MPASRPSIPALLSATIAAVGVGGVLVVAKATKAGTAPGNGEKVFDAPGCQPNEYDGPSLVPHYLLKRDCPRPKAVILVHSSYEDGSWHVTWDGSRSFDPVEGRLVRYEWISLTALSEITHYLGSGPILRMVYRYPGLYSVALRLTDDRGVRGAGRASVNLG